MKEVFRNYGCFIILDTGEESVAFSQGVVGDKQWVEMILRDTGRFFLLGEVQGRDMIPVYPIRAARSEQSIGGFATLMLNAASALLMAYEVAPLDTRKYMAMDSLPMLDTCQRYEGDDVKAGMLALAMMGHADELIEFLFYHFREEVQWP